VEVRPLWSGASRDMFPVIRAMCAALVAIAVAACAMAVKGWQTASFMLGAVIVLMGGLLVIQVSRALARMHSRSRMTSEAARRAEEHYVAVLQRVVRYIDARGKHTEGRSERIGKLAEAIARRMGLSDELSAAMNLAGQLHDIGLLAVPDGVLNNRGRLGGDEFQTVKEHSEVSYQLLEPLQSLASVLPAIRFHHERMNGTGYPQGLAGQAVPVEARMLAVADAYDAMTHDRPHRRAMATLDAMLELRRCAPAGYDEACVNALAEIINAADLEAVAKAGPAAQTADQLDCPTPRAAMA
jgi:HD-GYP domain-containing protein (c-di-GMP phosphodiesterase class II)